MANGESNVQEGLASLLHEKERDLELAAKIGQSLLEQNRELQNRNEFLEEHLSATNDTVVQLRHELQKRIELLRVYSHLDEDGENGSDESLRKRVDRLHEENARLKKESSSLRKDADEYAHRERIAVSELSRQLDAANDKVVILQSQIVEKNEECIAQAHIVECLLRDIAHKSGSEKQLCEENSELNRQLEEALGKHETLTSQIGELQEMYAEVKGMFHDAEEELRQYRQKPSPYRSPSLDSLFDSLASELENSDSGFSSTPYISARSEGANLRLEFQKLEKKPPIREHEEIDVPSAILADITRKKISIGDSLPAPPQTPQSERSTPTHNAQFLLETASPKKISEAYSIGLPLHESTPLRDRNFIKRTLEEQQGHLERKVSTACIETQTETEEFKREENLPAVESNPCNDCITQKSSLSNPFRHLIGFPGTSRIRDEPGSYGSTSKSSSSDSLSDYIEPKMGEPGVPGTRDLDFSIRQCQIRKQRPNLLRDGLATLFLWAMQGVNKVEKDYASFRQRKGLPDAPFFQKTTDGNKTSVPPSLSNDSWHNFAVVIGQEHSRSVQPWRAIQNVGLGVIRDSTGTGVLMRAELSSPNSSPARSGGVTPIVRGLAGILPSFSFGNASTPQPIDFVAPASGILSRRGI